MATYALKNLKTPVNVKSGLGDFILVAQVADFAVDGIKCPVAPFALPGDKIKIFEPHEFLATKAFAKIQCAPNINQLTGAASGDIGFISTEVTVDFFAAGSYAELHETMEELLNVPLIVLVPDVRCESKMWYQLGCDCISAYLTWDFTTGTVKDGKKGYSGKIVIAGAAIRLYEPTVLAEIVSPSILA